MARVITFKDRKHHSNPLFLELKEELHNRFNLISEERVKFFKHNSENLIKIG